MTTATEVTAVPAGIWAVDDLHSSARFEIEHGGLSVFRGGFEPIDAKLVADDDGAVLEGSVQVEGVSIEDENLRPHLLSPDFFDVARNPEIRFRSTELGGPAEDLTVAGELTMAGFTVAVERRDGFAARSSSPPASRSSRSRSRPRSTGPRSGWSGRWSCRAAARRSPTTSGSSSSSSCSGRPPAAAGLGSASQS